MTQVMHRGFIDDLIAGAITSAPDVRSLLVMSNTTADTEPDAQDFADITTLDEADGAGYARINHNSVAIAWDATDNRLECTVATDQDYAGGGTIGTCSRDIIGIVIYRHVDGTAANDKIWFYTDEVAEFPINPGGGSADFAPPGGLLFVVRIKD